MGDVDAVLKAKSELRQKMAALMEQVPEGEYSSVPMVVIAKTKAIPYGEPVLVKGEMEVTQALQIPDTDRIMNKLAEAVFNRLYPRTNDE